MTDANARSYSSTRSSKFIIAASTDETSPPAPEAQTGRVGRRISIPSAQEVAERVPKRRADPPVPPSPRPPPQEEPAPAAKLRRYPSWRASIEFGDDDDDRDAEAVDFTERSASIRATRATNLQPDDVVPTPNSRDQDKAVVVKKMFRASTIANLNTDALAVMTAASHASPTHFFFIRVKASSAFWYFELLNMALWLTFMVLEASASVSISRGYSHDSDLHVIVLGEIFLIAVFIFTLLVNIWGSHLKFAQNGSAIFDVWVLCVWTFDTLVFRAFGLTRDYALSLSVATASRVLRVLRLFWTLRHAKGLSLVLILFEGMEESIKPVLCALGFIGCYAVMWALTMSGLMGPAAGYTESNSPDGIWSNFGSLGRSMQTVLESMLCGAEWALYLRPIIDAQMESVVLIYILFVFAGFFGLMSLVQSIFIEIMSTTLENAEKQRAMKKVWIGKDGKHKLKEVFVQLDLHGDRKLSWEQCEAVLVRAPEIVQQVGSCLQMARMVFDQVDAKQTGKVDIDDFLENLMLRTAKTKTIDMIIVDYQQYRAGRALGKLEKQLTRDRHGLRAELRRMRRLGKSIAAECRHHPQALEEHHRFIGLEDADKLKEKARAEAAQAAEEAIELAKEALKKSRDAKRSSVRSAMTLPIPEDELDTSPPVIDVPPAFSVCHPGGSVEAVREKHLKPMLGQWNQLLQAEGNRRLRAEIAVAFNGGRGSEAQRRTSSKESGRPLSARSTRNVLGGALIHRVAGPLSRRW